MQRVARLLELKRTLGTDAWAGWLPAGEIAQLMEACGGARLPGHR